jgi:membrane-bound serine protease (ClpP class)
MIFRALSSGVERLLYTQLVGGSNPSARTLFICLLVALLAFPSLGRAESAPTPGPVYVLPIQGEIQKGTVYVVRRGVKAALEAKASALVLDMDTPGGEGEAMKEVMATVGKFEPADRTYTYVNKEAFSAGAFISAATRHIWMAPGAIIGAASPVTLGQEGPKELPPKFVSGYAALIRAAAEQNGHNPAVFDAMVNKQIGLKLDGQEIVAKGDILTLTTQEATRRFGSPARPLLAAGVAPNLESLINKTVQPGATIVRIEPTGFESISRWIITISPILLSAAFLFGYLEFKTPGFGLFGVLCGICAFVFLFGHYIAGLSGYENALLLLLGLALLITELFFFPGIFIPGLLGLALILFAALNTMIDRYPSDPALPTLTQLNAPVVNLAIGFFGGLTAILLAARFLPETALFRHFRLSASSPAGADLFEPLLELNAQGRALTDLRPSGTAEFDGKAYDVLAEGQFIPQGNLVQIDQIEGATIFVKASVTSPKRSAKNKR